MDSIETLNNRIAANKAKLNGKEGTDQETERLNTAIQKVNGISFFYIIYACVRVQIS